MKTYQQVRREVTLMVDGLEAKAPDQEYKCAFALGATTQLLVDAQFDCERLRAELDELKKSTGKTTQGSSEQAEETEYRKAIRTGKFPEIWPPIIMTAEDLEDFRGRITDKLRHGRS